MALLQRHCVFKVIQLCDVIKVCRAAIRQFDIEWRAFEYLARLKIVVNILQRVYWVDD